MNVESPVCSLRMLSKTGPLLGDSFPKGAWSLGSGGGSTQDGLVSFCVGTTGSSSHVSAPEKSWVKPGVGLGQIMGNCAFETARRIRWPGLKRHVVK